MQLAGAKFDFEVGTDVLVQGTAFLNHGVSANVGVSATSASALFGDADVTVSLTQSDVQSMLGREDGPTDFNNVITALENAGVDTISIDAGQVIQLTNAGFSFAGTDVDVLVQGTAFLNHGPGTGGVTATSAAVLFGNADVTVSLTQSDVQSMVGVNVEGDKHFGNVISALEGAGVDAFSIDAGQALQLAAAGFDFDVSANTDVVVHGTAFLGGAGGPTDAIKTLFGAHDQVPSNDVDVNLRLSDLDMQRMGSDAELAHQVANHAKAAGVDMVSTGGTLSLTPDQALTLGSALGEAGLELADSDSLRVMLTLGDVKNMNFAEGPGNDTVQFVREGLDGILDSLVGADFGANLTVDSVALDDELANALAEAGIDTDMLLDASAVDTFDVTVLVQADEGETAYLKSSLKDLASAGVDRVDAASGVENVFVALRDKDDVSESLGFSLQDLPSFNHAQEVGLFVDEDDLAALLGAGANVFDALKATGITTIGTSGNFDPSVKTAIETAGLRVQDAVQLTPAEVTLLGLNTDPLNPNPDPFDPFKP
jgi:hypothetical protein